jgi:hypothetical protein
MTKDAGRRSLIATAVVMIAQAVVFLLHAMGLLGERWWAFLIVASALWFLVEASLRTRVRLDGAAIVFFAIAVQLSLTGLAIYKGWNWGVVWPVTALMVGIAFLMNALRSK